MKFQEYKITKIDLIAKSTYILQCIPLEGSVFAFKPGQFCHIKNPTGTKTESRPFSITSLPGDNYLEFCIKIYGQWTKELLSKKIGETILILGPLGVFTWDDPENAVFLIGGVGIAPIISMFRAVQQKNNTTPITLMYGNRTRTYISYDKELENFFLERPSSKLIHILSEENDQEWEGYRGYITKALIEKEVTLSQNNTYYICGSGIFVDVMKDLLVSLGIDKSNIKQELYSPHGKS